MIRNRSINKKYFLIIFYFFNHIILIFSSSDLFIINNKSNNPVKIILHTSYRSDMPDYDKFEKEMYDKAPDYFFEDFIFILDNEAPAFSPWKKPELTNLSLNSFEVNAKNKTVTYTLASRSSMTVFAFEENDLDNLKQKYDFSYLKFIRLIILGKNNSISIKLDEDFKENLLLNFKKSKSKVKFNNAYILDFKD